MSHLSGSLPTTLDSDHVRAVPIPGRLRSVFPARLLRDWLARLCRELDLRLHAPMAIWQDGPVRVVKVFGVIEFVIDASIREVYGRLRCTEAGVAPELSIFDLWRPIRTADWVPWFMADTGMWPLKIPAQRDLFEREWRLCRYWLARSVFDLLGQDPRFKYLREHALPEALGLDRELIRIALHVRFRSKGWALSTAIYTAVWRNERIYRQVATENPNLLPLLHAYLDRHRLPPSIDPVQALKACFRADGVPDAGWRYVCRHGARLFRTVWRLTPYRIPIAAATLYVFRLYQCGLPPPPPAALLEACARRFDLYDWLFYEPNWEPRLCAIYRIAFAQARQVRGTADWWRFIDEFLGVAEWAQESGFAPDRNQRRAGWALIVRRWREAMELERKRSIVWESLVDAFDCGPYRVVPLTSRQELIDEASAMLNCLADYADDAEAGRIRLFSIRQAVSGRPVADLELRFDPMQRAWRVGELCGCANQPVTQEIMRVAQTAVEKYVLAEVGFTSLTLRNLATGSTPR